MFKYGVGQKVKFTEQGGYLVEGVILAQRDHGHANAGKANWYTVKTDSMWPFGQYAISELLLDRYNKAE